MQLLRLTPSNSHDQTVASWDVHVDRDARMRRGRDGFGNIVTMLYTDGPLDRIEISVSGEVVTSHSDGVVRGVVETLPPAVFLRTTDLTPAAPAIAAWAVAQAGDQPRLTALHALNAAMHARSDVDWAHRPSGLDAGAAWGEGAATPRDLAQIFVVARDRSARPRAMSRAITSPIRTGSICPRRTVGRRRMSRDWAGSGSIRARGVAPRNPISAWLPRSIRRGRHRWPGRARGGATKSWTSTSLSTARNRAPTPQARTRAAGVATSSGNSRQPAGPSTSIGR